MLTTATIEILSSLQATLKWENTGSLGTIITGEISTFQVKAELSTSSFTLKYILKGGVLPPGLNLNTDGTIEGISTATSQNTYTFNVSVIDSTGYEFLSNTEFKIETKQTTSTNFTTAFFKPYLNLEARKRYKNFINNREIFIPEFIYRPFDSNFGLQQELKMVLHYGIELKNLSTYANTLNDNFAKRGLRLGNLKTAVAIENEKKLYEIIYIDVVDDLNFKNIGNTSTSFTFNNLTYYPPSINNMRQVIKNSTNIKTTESLNPKFTKNFQPTTFQILGYIPFVPICYCIAEKSQIILKNIKKSKFEFNKINFVIDRLLIQKNLQEDQTKYLLFENRN